MRVRDWRRLIGGLRPDRWVRRRLWRWHRRLRTRRPKFSVGRQDIRANRHRRGR